MEPGSACRTNSGKVAPKYHTPRFGKVPSPARSLEVRTPSDRRPGTLWTPGPPVAAPPSRPACTWIPCQTTAGATPVVRACRVVAFQPRGATRIRFPSGSAARKVSPNPAS
ncbi:hypothetical protein [Streptomyces lincolnensis]|uniref:hypothetical protein n=1 Tax=Streptomyces lincolnensis TaxID=1915 RepID=UPI003AAFC655